MERSEANAVKKTGIQGRGTPTIERAESEDIQKTGMQEGAVGDNS